MSDPVLHAGSLFNRPFGYGYLDADGQKQVERLDDYRLDFEQARMPEARETAIANAARYRAGLQERIGQSIDRARGEGDKQWQQVVADVHKSLDYAKGLQGEQAFGGQRAVNFGSQVFKDALRARSPMNTGITQSSSPT